MAGPGTEVVGLGEGELAPEGAGDDEELLDVSARAVGSGPHPVSISTTGSASTTDATAWARE
jgi:hypothetical protein